LRRFHPKKSRELLENLLKQLFTLKAIKEEANFL